MVETTSAICAMRASEHSLRSNSNAPGDSFTRSSGGAFRLTSCATVSAFVCDSFGRRAARASKSICPFDSKSVGARGRLFLAGSAAAAICCFADLRRISSCSSIWTKPGEGFLMTCVEKPRCQTDKTILVVRGNHTHQNLLRRVRRVHKLQVVLKLERRYVFVLEDDRYRDRELAPSNRGEPNRYQMCHSCRLGRVRSPFIADCETSSERISERGM